jgi:hypothetical protein
VLVGVAVGVLVRVKVAVEVRVGVGVFVRVGVLPSVQVPRTVYMSSLVPLRVYVHAPYTSLLVAVTLM